MTRSIEKSGNKEPATYNLPKQIVTLLKVQAAVEGRSAGELVKEAVINYLLNKERSTKTLGDIDALVTRVREQVIMIQQK